MDAPTQATSNIRTFHDTLPNGLRVVTIEMPHLHSTELGVFIRAGLRFENRKNNGISHFLEHMMFRGNQKYPDSIALNREFENIGRDFRASTLSEYTYYGFNPHRQELDRAVELFGDFFREPTFPDIELERGIILEECLEDLNEEGVNIDINFHACDLLYPNDPLAWQTIGTEETIRSIGPEDLREYFREMYHTGNMILAGAGAISHDAFMDSCRRHLHSLPQGGRQIEPDYFLNSVREDQIRPMSRFVNNPDSQVQLQVCFRGVSYNDPDYYAVTLISRMFDDGVISRLQKALREDRGLVYSCECRATSLSDMGTFDFDFSSGPEKLVEILEVLFREIESFLHEGSSPEELAHVKRRYGFDLDLDLDEPYKQILRFGFAQLYSEEITVEQERERVEAVTLDDIHRLAQSLFVPEKLNVIVLGDCTPETLKEIETMVNNFPRR